MTITMQAITYDSDLIVKVMEASEPRPSRTCRDVGREATRESDEEVIMKEKASAPRPPRYNRGVGREAEGCKG